MIRIFLIGLVVFGLAGCGSSGHHKVVGSPAQLRHLPPPANPTQASAKFPLVAKSGQRLVEFYVQAGENNGFDFNGDSNGKLKLDIPLGWTVEIFCHNSASSLYHSCAVVSGASATSPVFPGASVPNPQEGINPGSTQSFTFVASQAGNFRLVCLVPGHESAGMWGTVVVSSTITDPELLS